MENCLHSYIPKKNEAIRNKLIILCDSFLGDRFEIPKRDILKEKELLNQKIMESKQLIISTQENIKKYLYSINLLEDSNISAIILYKWFIIREKMINSALNYWKLGNKFIYGLFWAPQSETINIFSQIDDIKEDRNIIIPHIKIKQPNGLIPPTYFRLNGFTTLFQEITNTYGVPRYKEINPTFFSLITFPFLFGVMFGDIGHGVILLLIGVFLWVLSDEARDSKFRNLHSLRYMITL